MWHAICSVFLVFIRRNANICCATDLLYQAILLCRFKRIVEINVSERPVNQTFFIAREGEIHQSFFNKNCQALRNRTIRNLVRTYRLKTLELAD